jgi:hypothetical protein
MATENTTTSVNSSTTIIIQEANVGKKIDYEINGNIISFNGGELALDLSKRQLDMANTTAISSDYYNLLAVGISKRRVATIDIPARTYKRVPVENGSSGMKVYTRVANPFDISKCVLTLWSVQ